MKAELHAVYAEHYGIRKELADRGARIDALAVDRSRFLNAPMPRWSEEAMSREPKWEAYRQDVTMRERAEAWRELFRR